MSHRGLCESLLLNQWLTLRDSQGTEEWRYKNRSKGTKFVESMNGDRGSRRIAHYFARFRFWPIQQIYEIRLLETVRLPDNSLSMDCLWTFPHPTQNQMHD